MRKIITAITLFVLMLAMLVMPAIAEEAAVEAPASFDWQEAASTILYAIMAAVVPILTGWIVEFVKAKRNQLLNKMEDEELKKGLTEASDAVLTAVTVTNQTYVESLKKQNLFDEIAQRNAFAKSWNQAQALLTDAAKQALVAVYGGVDTWLEAKIEETTNNLKQGVTLAAVPTNE